MGDTEPRTLDGVIGANVRAWRSAHGLRQPDLAEAMGELGARGWSASTVSKVEDGKRSISVYELLALGLALGATPVELLDPLAFGDTSAVGLPSGFPPGSPDRAEARQFQMFVRGEARLRFLGSDPKGGHNWKTNPTDRRNTEDVLAEFGGRLFRKGEEER